MSEDILKSSPVLRTSFVFGETFEAKPVTYSVVEERDPDTGDPVQLAVFEGCIVLGTAAEMEARLRDVQASADARASGIDSDRPEFGVGITGHKYRWPGGLVPYEIHSGLPNKTRVTQAIAHWETRTRIRFVQRTSSNAATYPNYLSFRDATGCWSYVGMRGGKQEIGLAAGCGLGATIHEIGHAIGLWHEQSREDRDQFITVHWQNITQGTEHNFNQHITDGDDYGPYDFGSIMHYGGTAFSRNGQPTIVPKQPGAVIGTRDALSPGDQSAVRSMYPNLEPSQSWLGVQFKGTVKAGKTHCWFTHSWPAYWHVLWNVVPTSPAKDGPAQIEWSVQATRQSDNAPGHGALLKYFICVKNLVAYDVNVEARYQVAGWLK